MPEASITRGSREIAVSSWARPSLRHSGPFLGPGLTSGGGGAYTVRWSLNDSKLCEAGAPGGVTEETLPLRSYARVMTRFPGTSLDNRS